MNTKTVKIVSSGFSFRLHHSFFFHLRDTSLQCRGEYQHSCLKTSTMFIHLDSVRSGKIVVKLLSTNGSKVRGQGKKGNSCL